MMTTSVFRLLLTLLLTLGNFTPEGKKIIIIMVTSMVYQSRSPYSHIPGLPQPPTVDVEQTKLIGISSATLTYYLAPKPTEFGKITPIELPPFKVTEGHRF